jgi:uncharacterized RDD family membrane protein YckC
MSSDGSVGDSQNTAELVLAKWSDRFFAWLIDFVIVNSVLWALFAATSIPFWVDDVSGNWTNDPSAPGKWALTSLVFMGYWTYFESTTGQSLGKMALKIRTTNLAGGKANIRNAAIQSFGKAFLLPLDIIFGWIFTNDRRQRIFGRLGETIVIKVNNEIKEKHEVRYRKD